ncbi:MAG: alpha/beta hydrolase [Streptosporangiales bacterium]|nr:alpha/beta hydrolase [Streptosporangiales bacterium]
MSEQFQVATSVGTAEVVLDDPGAAAALVVLGHGAGGGVDARDLVKVRSVLCGASYAVARVTQPYRMAGRKAPAPPRQLDAAFAEVVTALRGRAGLGELPLVTGGRSSGARVACRTSAAVGARGVVALAFPLHPPGRPEKSRADELHAVQVPVLVVQGERDSFGPPDEVLATEPPAGVTVHPVAGGNHGLAVRKGDPPALDAVADRVLSWLTELLQ